MKIENWQDLVLTAEALKKHILDKAENDGIVDKVREELHKENISAITNAKKEDLEKIVPKLLELGKKVFK